MDQRRGRALSMLSRAKSNLRMLRVAGCAVAAALLTGLLAVVPQAAADHLAPIAAEFEAPVELELQGWHTETIEFSGASGDRISIGMKSTWTADGEGRLYAPGSTTPLFTDDLYGWGASQPIVLPATGTYRLELESMTSYTTTFEVTVHRAEVVAGDLVVDGAASRFRLGVGDSLSLAMEGAAGQVVSVWPPGLQQWSEVDGFYDSTMTLIDPDGTTVVWDSSTSPTPYQPVLEAVTLPSTGTYTVKVDPWSGAEGHLAIRAALAPSSTTPLVENERASAELAVPGQDASFTFTAEAGEWIRLATPVAPYDADLVLEGPGNQTWYGSADAGGFGEVYVPQTGAYTLRVDGHWGTGEVWVKYREVPATQDVVLPMDGTPVTVTPAAGGQRVRFGLQTVPSQDVDIELVSNDAAAGELLRFDPYSPAGYPDGELEAGGKRRVGFWDEGGLASEYGVFFTPLEGSEGSVTARITSPLQMPTPVYGTIAADEGVVALTSMEHEFTAEVDPGTTYRLRVRQDETAESEVYISGEDLYVSSMMEAPESVVEFTTPAGTTPTLVQIGAWRSPASQDPADATNGSIELYSSTSTPDFYTYSGPVAPSDVQVQWAVDAIDAPVDGYAVLVDQNPNTDPGISITQQTPTAAPQLTPGEHWVHVRAIDNAQSGPVAHARILVATSSIATAPAAPTVSPGTPGMVTSYEPTLALNVPPTLTDVESVRFIVRSTTGKQLWSGDSQVDHGVASLQVPDGVLAAEGPFEARAQYVDANANPSIVGPVVSFTIDPLAPQVPAPACIGKCLAANAVLFDGTLVQDGSELLDIEALTDIGAGNWADSIDLEVEATGTSDALVRFNSGIPDPDHDIPTLLVPAGDTAILRVVPDDIYQVTLINAAGQATDVKVTALGWTPALDETDEAEREAAVEELAEEYLARGESLAGWQPPVIDEYATLPEPVCTEEDACIGFVGPGEGSPFEPAAPTAESAAEPLAHADAALSVHTPTAGSGAGNVRALSSVDESVDCESGEATGRWVVEDRFRACGVFEAWIVKPMFPPQNSHLIQMLVHHRARLSHTTSQIKYAFKVTAVQGVGGTSMTPYKANVAVKCSICVGGNISSKSTQGVAAVPGLRESNWVEHQIPVDVSLTDTAPKTSVIIDFDNPSAPPEHRISLDYSFDIPWFPDLSKSQSVYLPPIRCDGGNRTITGTKKGPGTHGCVFPFAGTPVLEINPGEYPNHATLVTRGQQNIAGNPGDRNGMTPLTRIPTWDHSTGNAKRSKFVRKNRYEATKMCKKLRFRKGLTCDEYPYASTANGCYLAPVPEPKCEVRRVPKAENYGAGGKLAGFIRQQRLLPGDSYFVDASPQPVPG